MAKRSGLSKDERNGVTELDGNLIDKSVQGLKPPFLFAMNMENIV